MGVVKCLLDTHTLLWTLCESPKLSSNARAAIADTNIQKFVSAASAYEIMYKHQLGKLPDYDYIAENYLRVLQEFGADELTISTQHAHYAGKFLWEHRDPFDRLLAAQAYIDNLTLITDDPYLKSLPWVSTLW